MHPPKGSRTQLILLTGMSGVGKSTLVRRLRALGHAAIDMDEPGWSYVDESGHQRWKLPRLHAAIEDESGARLFVAGCAEDQVTLYPRAAAIVLLSAPWPVMAERIATRRNNPYGQRPEERGEIRRNFEEIEPLLRRAATHEIVTTRPPADVVEAVLAISCLDINSGAAAAESG